MEIDVRGRFTLNKPLEDGIYKQIKGLMETRRVKRDPQKLEELGFGLAKDFGTEGEFFFINGRELEEKLKEKGLTDDPSIIAFNKSPKTQPSLYCPWEISDNKKEIYCEAEPDGVREPVEWLEYIVENFLKPNGYELKGRAIILYDYLGDGEDINKQDVVIEDGKIKTEYR